MNILVIILFCYCHTIVYTRVLRRELGYIDPSLSKRTSVLQPNLHFLSSDLSLSARFKFKPRLKSRIHVLHLQKQRDPPVHIKSVRSSVRYCKNGGERTTLGALHASTIRKCRGRSLSMQKKPREKQPLSLSLYSKKE